jgi:hypothetical protein
MHCFDPTRSPLDSIPPPEPIREWLARLFVEVRLARRLLRLSESKSRALPPGCRGERLEGAARREVPLGK